MNFNTIHTTNEVTLMRIISGSVAYGLNTKQSDTDIRGVFIQPLEYIFGLDSEEQFSDEKNDIVYYEIRKMFELLIRNNPNILDFIATPNDCVLYKHPIIDKIKPTLFLSKLCFQSFAGYAQMQMQKARGLNKKIVNPMSEVRKGLLDFCWIGHKQGSKSLKSWLLENNILPFQCGCIAIDHMKNCYHLFRGENYKGITDNDDVQIMLSSVEVKEEPLVTFYCNFEGFQKYCVEYNDYWKWVKNRNEDRYNSTMNHGKQYDAKNMMHTFRLLNMAHDIATKGEIIVRRPERAELLNIRLGNFEYEELVNKAQEKLSIIKEAFEKCDLQEKPNRTILNNLLIEIREEWYKTT